MGFPYAFPFVFDGSVDLAGAEAGSGAEAAVSEATLTSSDSGTGTEAAVSLECEILEKILYPYSRTKGRRFTV